MPPSPAPLYQRGVDTTTKISKAAVFALGSAILLFVAINSLLFTSFFNPSYHEIVDYRFDNPFFNLLCMGAAVALVGVLCRCKALINLSPHQMGKLLVIYVLVLGSFWVLVNRTQPSGEANNLSNAALAFMDVQEYDEWPHYFDRFPYQLGFTGYIQVFYTLFGRSNYMAIQLANVLWAAAAYYGLVQLVDILFENHTFTLVTTLLLCFTLYPIFYTTFIYGIIPGLGAGILALYFCAKYLTQRKVWAIALMLVFIGIACILKNNYRVFAIAMGILLLFDVFQNKSLPSLVALVLLYIVSAYCMVPVFAYYNRVMHFGFTTSSGVPLTAYIAMGLQEGSPMAPGWYNAYSYAIYDAAGGWQETMVAAINESIVTELQKFGANPAYAAEFFYYKTVSQWNESTCGAFLFSSPAAGPRSNLGSAIYSGNLLAPLLREYLDRFHFILFGGACVGVLANRKRVTLLQLLPLIIVIGGFVLHLFWEGKSQYMVQYFFLCTPYAAMGCVYLRDVALRLTNRLGPRARQLVRGKTHV